MITSKFASQLLAQIKGHLNNKEYIIVNKYTVHTLL